VLSRITRPTRGSAVIRGRVGSLLEVGTGFHPELTGRENVFMNGAMLGMRKAEIAAKFDEIVAFAEVSKFIDTPVKRYSSGMYVRLAFSVAAHLEPEILLVDEVLAVGDAAFQRRCLGKMQDVTGEGRTVLFVSHNTAAIQQLTSECLLLDQGRLVEQGPTDSVLNTYLNRATTDLRDVDVSRHQRHDSALGEMARLSRVRLIGDRAGSYSVNDDLRFEITVDVHQLVDAGRFSYTVHRYDGSPVGSAFGEEFDAPLPGQHRFGLAIVDPRLAPGRYYLALGFGKGTHETGFFDYDGVTETAHFEIVGDDAGGSTPPWPTTWGPMRMSRPVVTWVDGQQAAKGVPGSRPRDVVRSEPGPKLGRR